MHQKLGSSVWLSYWYSSGTLWYESVSIMETPSDISDSLAGKTASSPYMQSRRSLCFELQVRVVVMYIVHAYVCTVYTIPVTGTWLEAKSTSWGGGGRSVQQFLYCTRISDRIGKHQSGGIGGDTARRSWAKIKVSILLCSVRPPPTYLLTPLLNDSIGGITNLVFLTTGVS